MAIVKYSLFLWTLALFFLGYSNAHAQKPEAYLHQFFFKGVEDKTLVENVIFIKDPRWKVLSDAQTSVQLTIKDRQGKVVKEEEKLLKASNLVPVDVQNIFLPNVFKCYLGQGEYNLSILVKSKVSPDSIKEEVPFVVPFYNPDSSRFGSIEMLLRYKQAGFGTIWTKHGIDMELQPSYISPKTAKFIHIFTEFYNSKKQPVNMVRFGICRPGFEMLNNFTYSKIIKPADTTIVLLQSIDVSDLPSGNYYIRAEALDTAGKRITTKYVEFTRINPAADAATNIKANTKINISGSFTEKLTLEEVKKYLAGLDPIAIQQERHIITTLLTTQNTQQMQDYLLEFWKKRNVGNPEEAFKEYLELLKYAQKSYGVAGMNVFQTNRGRVVLQYGKPNRVDNELSDPLRSGLQQGNLVNYEVWTYYHTLQAEQNNVIFVFVQENQANNNYRLVHSTAIGEVYNPNWRTGLQNKYSQGNNGFNIDR